MNEDIEDLFMEAVSYGFDGNYSDAIRVLDEAIEATGRFTEKEDKSILWTFKAVALSKLNRKDEALIAIEKAIEYEIKMDSIGE